MTRRVSVGPGAVAVLPVLKGLVSEAAVVRDAMAAGAVGAVALSISPEELQTLKQHPDLEAPPANTEEEVYLREMHRFGDVAKPPPCFVEAVHLAGTLNLPSYGVDLDDEAYTDVYCREVKGLDLVRYSRGLRKLPSRPFPAATPEEFVLAFDKAVNRLRGHRRVEAAREAHMARSIHRLSRGEPRLLALVEYERFRGVQGRLEELAASSRPGPGR